MSFRRKYKHSKIISEIAEKTDLDPRIIHLIIRKFYGGLRKLMNRNEEINIQVFFTIQLEKSKKKIIAEKVKETSLRT